MLLPTGGLAIARPSAIAIAGVSPEDVSNLGIPIPQKKIIKKNYSGLASRTMPLPLTSQLEDVAKYRSTMLQTPYGDIKILIGPDYKHPEAEDTVSTASEKPAKPTLVDYSKDLFNSNKPENTDDEEILAEDYQEAEDAVRSVMAKTKYEELMAVAPVDSILNRYPLAPPKFTDYSQVVMARNSNKQRGGNYGYNQALAPAYYYQNLPVNAPYNYPYANFPYPAPMYFGY